MRESCPWAKAKSGERQEKSLLAFAQHTRQVSSLASSTPAACKVYHSAKVHHLFATAHRNQHEQDRTAASQDEGARSPRVVLHTVHKFAIVYGAVFHTHSPREVSTPYRSITQHCLTSCAPYPSAFSLLPQDKPWFRLRLGWCSSRLRGSPRAREVGRFLT